MQDQCNSRKWSENEVWTQGYSKYETTRRVNGQVKWRPIHTSICQESDNIIESRSKRIHYGGYYRQDDYKEKIRQYNSGIKKKKKL